jgi:hypothetical protein
MFPTDHVLGARRNGLNLVGMEMGAFNRVSGPVRNTDYQRFSNKLLDWYRDHGVRSVRITFTWEAVQSVLGGPVPSAAGAGYQNYWADLVDVVQRLLNRGIYVILAPWQYNGASNNTDIVYDGAPFSPASFADFWGRFAAAVNGVTGKDPRVAFDLINEPHEPVGDVGITLVTWFACAQAAITAIRAANAANTIFVPGMSFAAASKFVTNGSAAQWLATVNDPAKNVAVTVHCYEGLGSAETTVLREACNDVVVWARAHRLKVNVGEIALNAGNNGRPSFCSTFPIATGQWADWTRFCAANEDVLVGWNWWANSAGRSGWNEGDSCDGTAPNHWALTRNDGTSQTVYMDLIGASLPVARLQVRDNLADTGAEPNATTTVGWESPDIRVVQKLHLGDDVMGGEPSTIFVRVTNHGLAPSDSLNPVVRLYWAKASAGLSWPRPWEGTFRMRPTGIQFLGGRVGSPTPVGILAPGASRQIPFSWVTPDPADFHGDGHFCLLAFVTPEAAPEFAEFEGPNLNLNVLGHNDVAWRNIHVVSAGQPKLGMMVVENDTTREMLAQVGFEVLDSAGRPVDPARGQLLLTPDGAALETLRRHQTAPSALEDMGGGRFRVVDPAAGIPRLDLQPGDVVAFGVEYAPGRAAGGYAVRATQYSVEGGSRETVGGQTFVVGQVAGLTPASRRRWGSCLTWAVASAAIVLLAALFRRGRQR